jgi:hypothetical protein
VTSTYSEDNHDGDSVCHALPREHRLRPNSPAQKARECDDRQPGDAAPAPPRTHTLLAPFCAKFSDGTVSFARAEFSGGWVDFNRAKFSGSEVSFIAPAASSEAVQAGHLDTQLAHPGGLQRRAPAAGVGLIGAGAS